jgi:hypothetical protein
VKGPLTVLDVDFENLSGAWLADLKKAPRDPFWKGLHLEPRSPGRQTAKSIILLLLLMVAGMTIGNSLEPGCETLVGPEAPALSLPVVPLPAMKPVHKEFGSRDIVFREVRSTPECIDPVLEIRGLVGDRLFSGVFGGQNVVKKAGDSLGAFRVKSVLRDRVVLECGGKEWEVLNGKAP